MRGGITFNLRRFVNRKKRSPGRIHRRALRTVTLIKLAKLRAHFPRRLSNKRRRQITLTHTLTPQPTLVLLSRPFDGLSIRIQLRLHRRIQSILGRIGTSKMFIARSRRRTLTVTSRITIVYRNRLRRINDPRAICVTPTSHFVTDFIARTGFVPTHHAPRN